MRGFSQETNRKSKNIGFSKPLINGSRTNNMVTFTIPANESGTAATWKSFSRVIWLPFAICTGKSLSNKRVPSTVVAVFISSWAQLNPTSESLHLVL